jgi:hypothetical protein
LASSGIANVNGFQDGVAHRPDRVSDRKWDAREPVMEGQESLANV